VIAAVWTLLVAAQLTAAAPAAPAVSSDAAPKPVEIVLFSDFQCPYCALFAAPLREVQAHGVDGVPVKVTFKHYPLPMHERAPLAHQAALAAGEQGRFWEMHDLLFANQDRLDRGDLIAYAERLQLDVPRFRRDLDSDRLTRLVESDKADGNQLRVSATPTYFINGHEYSGAMRLEDLKRLVAEEDRRARAVTTDVPDEAMSLGSPAALVTLELFADLQSPVSAPTLLAVLDVLKRYPSDVRLQFRHFPLSFHRQAPLAHQAAVAAAHGGRFWEFTSDVLGHPQSLREEDLVAAAVRVGLDEAAFAGALRDHRYAARVDADVQGGLKKGVRGSPSLLVNGRRIDGVPTAQALIEYVDAALAASRQTDQLKKR
jgi:protein-disulfide isomerase